MSAMRHWPRELQNAITCQIQAIHHRCGWIGSDADLDTIRVIIGELREAASGLERLVEYVERGRRQRASDFDGVPDAYHTAASYDVGTFDDFGGAA